MKRTEALYKARKQLKIAKFERECRCTMEGNRRKKAYKVPGTPEHGQYSMLLQRMTDLANRWSIH